ncbi:hypothetical protein [Streptacidiphilus anmyonensis]|uniref:hypothetical protein n=1 Tax=Streptacidiphilus anmyonensis TaxID=405782 RepID=UPI0005A904BC|nr:hypothetical protein [Streptacidiphilus anmyonensis]
MEDEKVDISVGLPGAMIHPLPEDWEFLEAFVLIKARDEDGDLTWSFRTTRQIDPYELLGALTVQLEVLKRRLTAGWDVDDESGDEASDDSE